MEKCQTCGEACQKEHRLRIVCVDCLYGTDEPFDHDRICRERERDAAIAALNQFKMYATNYNAAMEWINKRFPAPGGES